MRTFLKVFWPILLFQLVLMIGVYFVTKSLPWYGKTILWVCWSGVVILVNVRLYGMFSLAEAVRKTIRNGIRG